MQYTYFDNRMEQTYCGISTAPNRKGPSYIFNNVIWNQGNSMGFVGNAIKMEVEIHLLKACNI